MTEHLQRTLTNAGIPAHKAETMTRSIYRGIALILLGILLLGAGVGLVIYIVLKLAKEPGLSVMILSGFLALAGVYFVVAGANIMSGQAMDAAARSPLFGIIFKLIRVWKTLPPDDSGHGT